MKKNIRIILAVAALILTSLACKTLQPGLPTLQPEPTFSAPLAAPVVVSQQGINQQETLSSLYENVSPGIVSIQVVTDQGGGLGTGFVVDGAGHIVTNYHVIEGQKQIEVDFTSGFKAYGTLVGTDLDSDLAIIKVDAPASELHPLAMGDSDLLKVGQSVVAIGNPFGLSSTMTLGIVSALGRSLPSAHESPGGSFFSAGDLIQTDASINPGNSGGPLLNLNGEVIGINRAIRTEASNTTGEPVNSGIGFSIAINIVKRVVPVIIETGKYDYPYMGVGSASDLSLDEINALGLTNFTGAYVTSIAPGGPAEKAGLIAGTNDVGLHTMLGGGDLIIAMDGQPIKNFDQLISFLINHKSPGDTVSLTVIRAGKQIDLPLVLTNRP
jgi:2-alkenal reductase